MRFILVICVVLLNAPVSKAAMPDYRQKFFEQSVRPLLVKRCFECHGPDEQKGGLRLDAGASIRRGGESGPAVVAGQPAESLLIQAVKYETLEMPPGQKLPDSEIHILSQWITDGVFWPEAGDDPILEPRQPGRAISDEDREYWAFQPVQNPAIPDDPASAWDDQHPIDGFILQKINQNHLAPSPPATRRQIARRLFFDLLGLPPSWEEINRFVQDDSPVAVQRLIDDLLARPQYGERWGRHWLDIVRFAETNGYERDDEKPNAWRYRDYVISALNMDKPYDQFIREQLAGDELDRVTHASLIATGFYRIGVWDDEPDDKVAAIHDELADILQTTGEVFLGLTIGCARCHDHKFDPIPQADYYQLLAFLGNVAPYGRDKSATHWETNPDSVLTPLVTAQIVESWKARRTELESSINGLKMELETAEGDAKKALEDSLASLEARRKKTPWKYALTVRENGPKPPVTRILVRGNHLTPGPEVQPGFLSVLPSWSRTDGPARNPESGDLLELVREQGIRPTSQRRRILADWITDSRNPLTARVIVNRLWHHHFGRGIVSTPSDFGRTGQPPSHPELLDWLAGELIQSGWSLKHIHRLILTSNTWQQASGTPASETARTVDPGNRFLWRQNLRRAEAEVIRDSMLAVSGELNPAMGGRGFFPKLSKEVLSTQSRSGAGWGESESHERCRRSVYVFAKRTLPVPMLEAHDAPVPDRSEPDRQTTTIAPQALILLNSSFVAQRASSLAERIIRLSDQTPDSLIRTGFRLVLSRDPDPAELRTLSGFIRTQSDPESLQDDRVPNQSVHRLALLLLNLNEFVYYD